MGIFVKNVSLLCKIVELSAKCFWALLKVLYISYTNLENISQGTSRGFQGCMKDLAIDNKPFGTPTKYFTQECTSSVESGSYIGADGGYIKLGAYMHRNIIAVCCGKI